MKDVNKMTQEEIRSYIADFIAYALRGTNEAYGIAKAAWGKNDKRTQRINNVLAECETLLREFRKLDKNR